jgi:diguanylate cyclase (GGDEF)-like protein
MRLDKKTTLFSALLSGALILVLVLVSLYSFRAFSIQSANAHVHSAAELVRVGLTELMINGVIANRAGFLNRVSELEGLDMVRVVRSHHVNQQYGPGIDSEMAHDEIESQVLGTGRAVFTVIDEGMSPSFRSTIPFIATTSGTPNCLSCHAVKEGDVLGAVTIRMSIAQMKSDALLTIAIIVVVVSLFALMIILVLQRINRPLVTTANDVQRAVAMALKGDFSTTIESRTSDEIGQIATDLNQLMQHLRRGLGAIRDNVAQLIQCKPRDGGNLLLNTTSMVEGLIDAARFKQSIEEDESKLEVYQRIGRIIRTDFSIANFSLYEIDSQKNHIHPVIIDGEMERDCRWCDPNILVRADSCRARRTGHRIDSLDTPHICNAYLPPAEHADLCHTCIPIIQSGSVGSVVQLVFSRSDAQRVQDHLPLLNVYLREAAPVIEAKRLMDTLRESNLRDPMTGLHNRRFLEEYLDTLVANIQRRKSNAAILMLDLDYFKKVNDTYGHDAGDLVLKELAKIFRQQVRASDMVVRYGGEEFLIILLDTQGTEAVDVANKIRIAVEGYEFIYAGIKFNKTLSIGLADYPENGRTIWQAIKFADVALYRAKEEGRNRVIHFTAEMWQEGGEY